MPPGKEMLFLVFVAEVFLHLCIGKSEVLLDVGEHGLIALAVLVVGVKEIHAVVPAVHRLAPAGAVGLDLRRQDCAPAVEFLCNVLLVQDCVHQVRVALEECVLAALTVNQLVD